MLMNLSVIVRKIKKKLNLTKGGLMDEFDEHYEEIVELYAHLAMQPAWVEYIRDQVRQKMQNNRLWENLAKDVKTQIEEKKNEKSS